MIRKFSTLLAGISILAIAGCNTAPPASNETGSADNAAATAPVATEKTDTLVVYSGRSDKLVDPLIKKFEKEKGIKVTVKYGSTPEIAATILEEGEKSPADVFFAQDPGGLGAIAKAGLLAPLSDETLEKVQPQFRADDKQWVGVAGRTRVVAYNTDKIKPESLPADIADFTKPEWKGRIGWAPANASFHAMVTAMRIEWGEERTLNWVKGIHANKPVVYKRNGPAVEGVANGEVDVAFVNNYYLYRYLKEHGEKFKARNHFLTGGGPGSMLMVAGAGHLKNGKNTANAQTFIDYLVSKDAQEYFTKETSEYPVVDGVAPPKGAPTLDKLNIAKINLSDLSDVEGTTKLLQKAGVIE